MTTNMRPADELLTIRNRIKELQTREKEIKAAMQSGEMETHGDFAIARFVKRKSKRFNRKAAEVEFGDLSRFEIESETTALLIDELDLEIIE